MMLRYLFVMRYLRAHYSGLKPSEIPATEALKDTVARVLPAWHDEIAPMIKSGKRVCGVKYISAALEAFNNMQISLVR